MELLFDRFTPCVLANQKFRLQHNAVGVRRKHFYHSTDACCPAVEFTRHLFRECSVASLCPAANPYVTLVLQDINWANVVYLHKLHFTDASVQAYSYHNAMMALNFLCCAALYLLWLHRDDHRFQAVSTSVLVLLMEALAYASLNLKRLAVYSVDNHRLGWL
uniref:Uncharacterized protein n=1 Tax=Hyaloperonospora arabidopsidis (strain Emoy2) TaxID=559515 RepID=M4BZ64_HYAAE